MSSPWTVPGVAVPQPERTPVHDEQSNGGAAGAASVAVERPLPPVPLPLRPMTIPDLLDGSFTILKRRPREVLLLAAAFVLPIQLVSAVLFRDQFAAAGFGGTGLGDANSVGFDESGGTTGAGPLVVSLIIGFVSLALLAGALTVMVVDWYAGRERSVGATIVATLRRAPALIVGAIVVHLIELGGVIALVIGAYVAMAFLQLVSPVIVAESVGPFRAIVRSVQLTRAKPWRSLAVPFLVAVVGSLVGFGFQLLPELAAALTPDRWNWLLRASGSMLSQLVVAPFTAGVAVLHHLDLRIRTEGYDLELRVLARS